MPLAISAEAWVCRIAWNLTCGSFFLDVTRRHSVVR
jgi:hypothetical protein